MSIAAKCTCGMTNYCNDSIKECRQRLVYELNEVSQVSCDLCGHIWVAVRPVGVEQLECPNCGTIGNFENV